MSGVTSKVLEMCSELNCRSDEQCGARLGREGPQTMRKYGGWLEPAAIGSCISTSREGSLGRTRREGKVDCLGRRNVGLSCGPRALETDTLGEISGLADEEICQIYVRIKWVRGICWGAKVVLSGPTKLIVSNRNCTL
jgi:hypothetical protein